MPLDFFCCKLHSYQMKKKKDKFPSQTAERFQIRLPDGLRDRIKTYAEKHGRSMNTEIVRILEREFPEPIYYEQRLSELLTIIKSASCDDDIHEFVKEVEATLNEIDSGRIIGISQKAKKHLHDTLVKLREDEYKNDAIDYQSQFDEEELNLINQGYNPFKIVTNEEVSKMKERQAPRKKSKSDDEKT